VHQVLWDIALNYVDLTSLITLETESEIFHANVGLGAPSVLTISSVENLWDLEHWSTRRFPRIFVRFTIEVPFDLWEQLDAKFGTSWQQKIPKQGETPWSKSLVNQ
jgi:hypothetical protein